MLSLTTVAAEPDHRCFVPEVDQNITSATYNVTGIDRILMEDWIPLRDGKWDGCEMFTTFQGNATQECVFGYVFDDTYYGSTKATEWGLVCGKRWMRSVAQSTYMLGNFKVSFICDRHGGSGSSPRFAVLRLRLVF